MSGSKQQLRSPTLLLLPKSGVFVVALVSTSTSSGATGKDLKRPERGLSLAKCPTVPYEEVDVSGLDSVNVRCTCLSSARTDPASGSKADLKT